MQHNSFNKSKQCKPTEAIVINVKLEDRQMSNINRWVVCDYYTSHEFPCWEGKIFRSRNEEEQKETVRRIYALAYEEELYRVIKKGKDGNDPKILFGLTKLDFHPVKEKGRFYDENKLSKELLVDEINEDGLSLFDDCEEQCKVSYYSLDGQIVTEWVERFLILHKNLRSEKYVEDRARSTPGVLSPVEIDYGYNSDNGYERYTIYLYSDIWFPRVVGWIDPEKPYYDNSKLAELHTPRLNRFLQRTKELILSLGGEWELVREKPIVVEKRDLKEGYYDYYENNYYNYYGDLSNIIDTKIVCIDGVKKEVYPPLSNYKGVTNISTECQISEDGISLEMDLKPRNHWCIVAVNHSESLPVWRAKLPTHEDAWPFVKTILEVGQQEEIFRIFEEEAEFRRFIRDVDSGIIPMPSLEALVEEEFATDDNLPEYIRNIKGMTKVSYYEKDGQLADKYLQEQDFSRFLYNYHLGNLGDYQRDYRKKSLHPYSGCLEFFDRLAPIYAPGERYLQIALTSDIWFPIVDGSMERKVGINMDFDEETRYEGGFDNRELANRHTPRLNRFLSAIAAKVIEMGGEWSIGEDVGSEYRKKMTLTGIKLNI
jgi:hypothetical protein